MTNCQEHGEYSCLMSVYDGESASNLRRSLQSVFDQTVPPFEFVVVCDGPLHDGLERVLVEFREQHPSVVKRIDIPESKGLWNALSKGMAACSGELIMRMDSDDWSAPDRAEKQLELFRAKPDLDCCGSLVVEFSGKMSNCVSQVRLPERHEDIVKFSKRRNPMRHPAMMYKRESVVRVGGYQEALFFEDYDLVLRMIRNGCIFHNIQENLVYMQIGDGFYRRRGDLRYLGNMLQFRFSAFERGDIGFGDFLYATVAHSIVCILPNRLRALIYQKLLRESALS